jgi:cytochrome c peroxidase
MTHKNQALAFILAAAALACFIFILGNFKFSPVSLLNCNCPPGFQITEDNACISRNLYQQYSSLQNVGVGGLKSALPTPRDGFTPQQIDLGRLLFFDPILSKDGTVSCATCHNPYKGFADGMPVTIGVGGVLQTRSAPTLWNVAYLNSFFWDGRAHTLEEQMQGPMYSSLEMGNTRKNLLATINTIENYRPLFKEAFPNGEKDSIQLDQIYKAISAFESSLISLNSKYDRYAHGYVDALSEKEIEGLNIFRSFVARCAECHTPPLFTNQQIAIIGVPELDGKPRDVGAELPNNDPSMRGGFKVPSLRNIANTAPYMHSGSKETLRDAAEFYNLGRGHALQKEEDLILHWHIWEPNLTDDEIDRLVDFMNTLTDESFLPVVPKEVPSGLPVNINKPTTALNLTYNEVL